MVGVGHAKARQRSPGLRRVVVAAARVALDHLLEVGARLDDGAVQAALLLLVRALLARAEEVGRRAGGLGEEGGGGVGGGVGRELVGRAHALLDHARERVPEGRDGARQRGLRRERRRVRAVLADPHLSGADAGAALVGALGLLVVVVVAEAGEEAHVLRLQRASLVVVVVEGAAAVLQRRLALDLEAVRALALRSRLPQRLSRGRGLGQHGRVLCRGQHRRRGRVVHCHGREPLAVRENVVAERVLVGIHVHVIHVRQLLHAPGAFERRVDALKVEVLAHHATVHVLLGRPLAGEAEANHASARAHVALQRSIPPVFGLALAAQILRHAKLSALQRLQPAPAQRPLLPN
mmetsp:Transcript_11078/g.26120  ORF Transcript_11078/g.26120 Transcript_11078/m.26120 type:complete len:350 (-) Transcript_11078:1063-2112(-)